MNQKTKKVNANQSLTPIKINVNNNTLVLINKLERILDMPADSIIADLIKQASQGYGLIEARD